MDSITSFFSDQPENKNNSNLTVCLPKYLDKLIFDELSGFYRPCEDVDINLYNTPEQNRKYLGTYFPRSFAESYRIFNNVFKSKTIMRKFSSKVSLNILDLGTGTGGNLIGLLEALAENDLLTGKEITIITLEGNSNAIEYQKHIVKAFCNYRKINLHSYIPVEIQFSDTSQLVKTIEKLEKQMKFDIVMSFKFLSEFYNAQAGKSEGTYHNIAIAASGLLNDHGLMLLLDVTSRDLKRSRTFMSIIMNNELRRAVNEPRNDLSFIAPMSCAQWACKCVQNECFTQMTTVVSHRFAKCDTGKSNFKLMAHREFASEIMKELKTSEIYQVSYNQYPKYCRNAFVLTSDFNSGSVNAFDLTF